MAELVALEPEGPERAGWGHREWGIQSHTAQHCMALYRDHRAPYCPGPYASTLRPYSSILGPYRPLVPRTI